MANVLASSLGRRTVSAVVMAPPVLAALWVGGLAFFILIAVAAAILAWEWDRMCGEGRFGGSGYGLIAVLAVALAAALRGRWDIAAAACLAGTLLVYLVSRLTGRDHPWTLAAGAAYIGLPCLAMIWLRDGWDGRATLFWLMAVVWSTDIGAYLAGRAIGGPLLAPAISPKKTWAGLGGGMASAFVAGAVTGLVLGQPNVVTLALLSGSLAVVAQGGDLLESAVKRHFGVKDSSNLIPGHGGLFDRVDGLLAAVAAVTLLNLIAGASIFAWT